MDCFLNTPEFIFIVEILNNTNDKKREGEEIGGSVQKSQTDLGLNVGPAS